MKKVKIEDGEWKMAKNAVGPEAGAQEQKEAMQGLENQGPASLVRLCHTLEFKKSTAFPIPQSDLNSFLQGLPISTTFHRFPLLNTTFHHVFKKNMKTITCEREREQAKKENGKDVRQAGKMLLLKGF